jgi:hypothetical protein
MTRIYELSSVGKNVTRKKSRGLFSDAARMPQRGRLSADPLAMCKFERAQKNPGRSLG